MSDKYRVVVELYSDSNPNLLERKIIDDKSVKKVTSIYELGLRHTNQIKLLQDILIRTIRSKKVDTFKFQRRSRG